MVRTDIWSGKNWQMSGKNWHVSGKNFTLKSASIKSTVGNNTE